MFHLLAQEEAAKEKANAAAREKKAAKKARRKERDAALKAASRPQPAASAAPTAANGPNEPQVSTDATAPADLAAASVLARATAAQAASMALGANVAGDCTPNEGPAAMPDVSEPMDVDRAAHTPASDEAALPAAPAEASLFEAECLLPPSQDSRMGGDGADVQKIIQGPEAVATGAGGSPEHQTSDEEMVEADADADGTLSTAASSMGTPESRNVARHRGAALEVDPSLLCPITQVGVPAPPRCCTQYW